MKRIERSFITSYVTCFIVAFILSVAFLGWGGIVCVQPVWGAEEGYRITVLHTNDIHSHFMPFDLFGGTCDGNTPKGQECIGGIARMETKVEEIRSGEPNSILVDAGDQFQGSLFFTRFKGEASKIFMNRLGYNAMAVGNHEFDSGPCTLSDFVRGVPFPVLSANIDAAGDECLKGLIKPFTVIEAGGDRIGVVGYTTETAQTNSRPGPNVAFGNIETSVAAAVGELKKMGINKIIALSHAGVSRDEIVAGTVDGLDVIVAGHSHTFLSNTDLKAEGPYPIVVRSPSGAPVLIVSSGSWGRYLGRLEVAFDGNGVPVAWDGGPIRMDASVPEDPEAAAQLSTLNKSLEEIRKKVVGTNSTPLAGEEIRCRFEECALGNLIADAILAASEAHGATIALTNGGGIRSGLPAGEVNMGQIHEISPFGNIISIIDLRGADIRTVLENAVSRAHDLKGEGTGRFLQTAGLRFAWNPELSMGSRVTGIEVRGKDGAFTPLKDDEVYRIATNNYLRHGGDGYTEFSKKGTNINDDGPTMEDALVGYIGAHSPVAPKVEGRITLSPSKHE